MFHVCETKTEKSITASNPRNGTIFNHNQHKQQNHYFNHTNIGTVTFPVLSLHKMEEKMYSKYTLSRNLRTNKQYLGHYR